MRFFKKKVTIYNPTRRYSNSKYLCSKHGCPQVHKTNTLSINKQIGPDAIIVGDFNTPVSSIDRTSRQKN
jgi:hypothetical protein